MDKTSLIQIKDLTLSSMKARYRKTFAGFIWVVISPIIMFSVQGFVFKKFLSLELPNYTLFLLGGLLPWIFIISSWEMSTASIVSSGETIKSFAISPFIIISAQILDNFFNFIFAFFIILIPITFYTTEFHWSYLFLPVPLIVLFLFTWLTTCLFALFHVFYRDIKYMVTFSVSILFFLTPIFYPLSFVPEKYRWIVDVNPLYSIVVPFRNILYENSIQNALTPLLKSLVLLIIMALTLKYYWRKNRNELYISI